MKITVANDDDIEFLENKLLSHNLSIMDSTQDEPYKRFSYIVKHNDKIIGGIVAYSIIWKILYLDTLWVDPNYRRKNIGSTLLYKVLEEGEKYGCKFVHLDTFEFQGYEFYMYHNFKVFGVLEDSPQGYKEYFLTKSLNKKGNDVL